MHVAVCSNAQFFCHDYDIYFRSYDIKVTEYHKVAQITDQLLDFSRFFFQVFIHMCMEKHWSYE